MKPLRVSPRALSRRAPIVLLLAIAVSGLTSLVAPTAAQADFITRQCLNWGQFGIWELGPNEQEPTPDTIDRTNFQARTDYLLPEGDGRMLGSISVPAKAIMANDTNVVWDDDEEAVLPNTRILTYTPPAHASRFVLHTDGSFEYTPEPGYFGADTFQYVWERTTYCSQPGTVTIKPIDRHVLWNDAYTVDGIASGPFAADSWPPPEPFSAGKLCGLPGICGVLVNDPKLVATDRGIVLRHVGAPDPDGWRTTDHGKVRMQQNGAFEYVPNAGYLGPDGFEYKVGNESVGPVPEDEYHWAAVTLTVQKPENGDVKTVDDAVTVTEDITSGIGIADLIANDQRVFNVGTIQGIDTNFSQPPTVRTVHGSLKPFWRQISPFQWVIDHLEYTPDHDYIGPDWFTYLGRGQTTSGNPAAKTGIVVITIENTDDPPVARGEIANTRAGVPVTLDPTANDYDPDGDLDLDSFHLVTTSNLTLNPDRTVTYTPPPDLGFGVRIFLYTIADARGVTVQGVFNTRVVPGIADAYTTAEGSTLTVDSAHGVKANDGPTFGTDIGLIDGPTHGDLDLAADGSFTYTPDADFAGPDQFTYKTTGGLLGDNFADPTVVKLTVTDVADAPAITFNLGCTPGSPVISCSIGDLRQVDEGGTVRLRGFIDDADVAPAGTLTVDWGDGTSAQQLAYPCEANGAIGAACTTKIGYAPTFLAEAEPGRVFFDLSHTYRDDPAGATPSFTITATADDGTLDSLPATTQASVANVRPTLIVAADCTPTDVDPCFGDHSDLTVTTGDDVDVRLRIRDVAGEDLRLVIDWGDFVGGIADYSCTDPTSVCSDPAVHQANSCDPPPITGGQGGRCGWVTLHHTYAAPGDYPISMYLTDGDGGTSDTFTGTAHVQRLNAAPSAVDDEYTVDEDGTLTVSAGNALLKNDSDADAGDSLTASVKTNPTKGAVFFFTAGGTFQYSPNPNAFGDDTFTYQACDTLAVCTTATVTIHITAKPDAPVAVDDAYTTDEDTGFVVVAPGAAGNDRDPDGDTILVTQYADPPHGTAVTGADGQLEYLPDTDRSGVDTFTYTVCDPTERCSTGTIRVTVHAVNDQPVAGDDVYEVVAGELLTVNDLLANDSDVDSVGLITSLTGPAPSATEFSLGTDGSFRFRSSVVGDTLFSYAVADPQGASDVGDIKIIVLAANGPPTATPDGYATDEDVDLVVGVADGVLDNDSDPNTDELTATLVDDVDHGTLSLAADGSFVYEPATDYHGPDAFTYTAGDGELSSATTTVRLTVTPVNDAPTADGDAYTTPEDTTLSVPAAGVLADDQDVDGDALMATLVSGPAHGSLTLNANGSFSYTPAGNYFGTDSFTYRAEDASLHSGVVTVDLTVASRNDTPTITLVDGACRSETDPIGSLLVRLSDVETAAGSLGLTTAGTPAGQKILPNGSVALSGTGADRTAVVTVAGKNAGTATLTFTVTDGQGGSAVLAVNVITGGSKANTITGIVGPDLIFGASAADTLTGGPAGDTSMDVLCGGAGADTLRGGAGNDVVNGGSGVDVVEGGAGDDQLFGASGADTLRGQAGADRFHGGQGADSYADYNAGEGDVRVEPA